MNSERAEKLFKAYDLCTQIYFLRRYPEAIDETVKLLERFKTSYELKDKEYVVLDEVLEK